MHNTIWKIANNLCGSVDGWDFKSYVLGILFYKFISENLVSCINEIERKILGQENFNYSKLTDEDAEYGRSKTIDEKGLFQIH